MLSLTLSYPEISKDPAYYEALKEILCQIDVTIMPGQNIDLGTAAIAALEDLYLALTEHERDILFNLGIYPSARVIEQFLLAKNVNALLWLFRKAEEKRIFGDLTQRFPSCKLELLFSSLLYIALQLGIEFYSDLISHITKFTSVNITKIRDAVVESCLCDGNIKLIELFPKEELSQAEFDNLMAHVAEYLEHLSDKTPIEAIKPFIALKALLEKCPVSHLRYNFYTHESSFDGNTTPQQYLEEVLLSAGIRQNKNLANVIFARTVLRLTADSKNQLTPTQLITVLNSGWDANLELITKIHNSDNTINNRKISIIAFICAHLTLSTQLRSEQELEFLHYSILIAFMSQPTENLSVLIKNLPEIHKSKLSELIYKILTNTSPLNKLSLQQKKNLLNLISVLNLDALNIIFLYSLQIPDTGDDYHCCEVLISYKSRLLLNRFGNLKLSSISESKQYIVIQNSNFSEFTKLQENHIYLLNKASNLIKSAREVDKNLAVKIASELLLNPNAKFSGKELAQLRDIAAPLKTMDQDTFQKMLEHQYHKEWHLLDYARLDFSAINPNKLTLLLKADIAKYTRLAANHSFLLNLVSTLNTSLIATDKELAEKIALDLLDNPSAKYSQQERSQLEFVSRSNDLKLAFISELAQSALIKSDNFSEYTKWPENHKHLLKMAGEFANSPFVANKNLAKKIACELITNPHTQFSENELTELTNIGDPLKVMDSNSFLKMLQVKRYAHWHITRLALLDFSMVSQEKLKILITAGVVKYTKLDTNHIMLLELALTSTESDSKLAKTIASDLLANPDLKLSEEEKSQLQQILQPCVTANIPGRLFYLPTTTEPKTDAPAITTTSTTNNGIACRR